ncbi:MAG: DUF2179 domain-containing protein [Bacteroidales bacterium]
MINSFDFETWILIPAFIFVARILDVSIGTLRLILMGRGYKKIAPILGFIEILIWVIAISKIMENLNNWINYIFYAAGFSAGTYIGMYIEEKLAIGKVGVRIITRKGAEKLIKSIGLNGFGVTYIEAKGNKEDVHVIFTTCKRKRLNKLLALVHDYNPNAFYTIEDIRWARDEYQLETTNFTPRRHLFRLRKGK